MKYGAPNNGVIVPQNPALHVQPLTTFAPLLSAGQGNGLHVDVKYGETVVAVTVPDAPAAHVHPLGTVDPTENAGHGTAVQGAA